MQEAGMANEILVVNARDRKIDLLFLFPLDIVSGIASPPEDYQGVPFVLTPSSTLPVKASEVLTQSEKNQLDSGTLIYETISFDAPEGMTNQQILDTARQKYTRHEFTLNIRYPQITEFYNRIGNRFDAST